jgi:hypothetical protein
MNNNLIEQTKSTILEANFLRLRKGPIYKTLLRIQWKIHPLLLQTASLIDQHFLYYQDNNNFSREIATLTEQLAITFHQLSRDCLLSPISWYQLGFTKDNCVTYHKEKISTILGIDDTTLSYTHDPTIYSFFFSSPPANGSLAVPSSLPQPFANTVISQPYGTRFNKKLSWSQW